MKKLKSLISIMLTTIVIISSNSMIFANDEIKNNERMVTSPAKYEYTTKTVNLNKTSLDKLHTYAYRTNKQNSKANIVSLGSYMLGLVGLPNASTIVGTVANMMQSGLDVVETMNYSYQNYKYLVNNPKVKTVRTKIPYRRFFDGNKMHPWHPWSYPKRG